MRIALAQIDCEVGAVDYNTSRMLNFVKQAATAGCDTIVFPEMSDTGYVMPVILEKASSWTAGPAVQLAEAALQHDINIVSGLSERIRDKVFNGIAAIDRDGKLVARYHKTHLITAEPMLEHHHLGAGETLTLALLDGIKVGFLTCYEVRFPELWRLLTDAGAQIVFLPAAFPLSRIRHWEILAQARAIENQIFVIAANRVGTDGPGLIFGGTSQIIEPSGTVAASASVTDEKLLIADIDLAQVAQVRDRLKVHQDRRHDLYTKPVNL